MKKNAKINDVPGVAAGCTGSSSEVGRAALTGVEEGGRGVLVA